MTDDKQFSKNDFERVIRGLPNTKPRPSFGFLTGS